MDIMPRAETRPDPGQLVDPPSMTFGFPFVPLRDWAETTSALPYSLPTAIDDTSFPGAGTYPPFGLGVGSPWLQQEDC